MNSEKQRGGRYNWPIVTGKQRLVAGLILASICVFAAIAVSVVEARRPLDGRVSKSFDSRLSQTTHIGARVTAQGCKKKRVDFYDCPLAVHPDRGGAGLTVRYELRLREDLCWTATTVPPFHPPDLRTARLRFGALSACF
jgi:hypothetical protein